MKYNNYVHISNIRLNISFCQFCNFFIHGMQAYLVAQNSRIHGLETLISHKIYGFQDKSRTKEGFDLLSFVNKRQFSWLQMAILFSLFFYFLE